MKILQEGLTVADETKIAKRFLLKEGYEVKSADDNQEAQYRTFDEESSKLKQKMANRLKSRGFRGEVISRLVF